MDRKHKYSSKLVTADEAVSHIRSGNRILLQQGQMLSEHIVDALLRRNNQLKDISLFSSICYCKEAFLEPQYANTFKYYCCFLSSNSRQAFYDNRLNYTPMYFKSYPRFITQVFKPDVFIINVTPPDDNGYCSFSMSGDWCEAGKNAASVIIAQLNKNLPRTNGTLIHMDEITWAVEYDSPVKEVLSKLPGETEIKIAQNIAPLIEDGSCLQAGIGAIPDVVLSMLKDKKNLGIHTELFSDAFVDLVKSGAVTNLNKSIDIGVSTATFAVGSQKLFDFIDNNSDFLMLPVEYINDPSNIAKNNKTVAINACLQVDLFGQVNSDTINGITYSGAGGQVDFVRGAGMSNGGKAFMTLPSTAVGGTVSRIVGALPYGTPVTTGRFDVQYVATEYGVVNLWGLTNKQKAKALISIAHPDFRNSLEEEAFKLGLG